jgi:hypothetical protein
MEGAQNVACRVYISAAVLVCLLRYSALYVAVCLLCTFLVPDATK